jgi:hypothetical protein
MANVKITDLSELTAPESSDVLAVVDVSTDTTKKITGANLTKALSAGTTTAAGIVQLENSTSSTSTSKAATPSSVKSANDLAAAALPKSGGTMTGDITFAGTQAFPSSGLPVSSTSVAGIVQLTNSTSSTSTTTAATPSSVKTAWDLANAAMPKTGGTFTGDVTFNTTTATKLPVGTTGERPTGSTGMVRYNSSLNGFEGFSSAGWGSLGGGATGAAGDKVFVETDQTITTSYTLTAGKNAMTAGPVTVASGATVTIPSGAAWVIV